jgi:hypothetical protein
MAKSTRGDADSPALNNEFTRLLEENNNEFRTYAAVFAKIWQIFNVKDRRKKKLRYDVHHLDRTTYVTKLVGAHVQHAARGEFDRDKLTGAATTEY